FFWPPTLPFQDEPLLERFESVLTQGVHRNAVIVCNGIDPFDAVCAGFLDGMPDQGRPEFKANGRAGNETGRASRDLRQVPVQVSVVTYDAQPCTYLVVDGRYQHQLIVAESRPGSQ